MTSPTHTSPRVSVVMATHRLDHYLPLAIESLREQSLQDWECVFVLDAGLRDQHEAVRAMCGDDPRFRLLEAPSLGGLALALNLGIGHARAPYVARMDGDDISLPERLKRQADYLDRHPETMVLGCRVDLIDADGDRLPHRLPFYEGDAAIRRQLPFRSPLSHPALMFRKDALYAVGGYKYGRAAEDWELYLRLAQLPGRRFYNLPETLFLHRRHAEQGTGPQHLRKHFHDSAGFLLSEALRKQSPRFAMGAMLRHHWVTGLRRRMLGRDRMRRQSA